MRAHLRITQPRARLGPTPLHRGGAAWQGAPMRSKLLAALGPGAVVVDGLALITIRITIDIHACCRWISDVDRSVPDAFGVLLASSVAMPMDIGIPSSAICTTHPYNTSTCWLGYEFDSSLGYPGEGPPVELEKPFEVDTDANWLEQLEQEKLEIEALPFVSKVDFFCDEHTQNLNKVIATVWCCWDSSSRSFKRVFENCDQSGKKPTHLEAARALRTKLLDSTHARTGHVFDHRAVTRREELMRQQQGAETTEAETAFNRIGLAQARQQAAARQASAAEQAAEAARQAEIAARLACEAAELQAKALRAAADALKPKEPSHKKQKTAFAAGSSSQQTDVCEPALDDDEPRYTTWSATKWKELETKEQQRRTKPIDPTNEEVNLPDGDATRGWRKHWRRGMYGAIMAWAAGSQGAVIFMLAECVIHFKVVEAVGKHLGLVLSEEAVAQAEVDAHIIERVKAVLHVLKYCQSEVARIEYGILLAALAPVRRERWRRAAYVS